MGGEVNQTNDNQKERYYKCCNKTSRRDSQLQEQSVFQTMDARCQCPCGVCDETVEHADVKFNNAQK